VSRLAQFLVFFLLALAVLGGMHYYLWARLVRDPGWPEPWRRILTAAIALGAVAVPAGMLAARLLQRPVARLVPLAAFGWLGLAFLLFSALLALDVARAAGATLAWLAAAFLGPQASPADPTRRVLLARAVAGGAALAGGGSAALAVRRATGEPRVKEVQVKLPRLPPALRGLSIAQITDFHVGPTIRGREVRRVVEMTNALRPDLVAITGDLVDGSVAEIGEVISEIGRLRSRYGVTFVTGNHEYYSGVGPWLRELPRLGVRVLRNERISVGDGPGGASIDLAGIDDWRSAGMAPGHGPDLPRALSGRDPERALVLLAHQPLGFPEALRAGVGLQISGHTHGGQIFPFSLLVGAVYRFSKGLYRLEEGGAEGWIYVSSGTGYWGPPMRLGTSSEITRIVLG
jgi:hypothetical protein